MQFSQSQIDAVRRTLKQHAGHHSKLVDIFWKLQRGVCALCGCRMDREHPGTPGYRSVDHIIPTSRGGTHEETNRRLAHRDCNSDRGNQLDEEMLASRHQSEEIVRRFLSRDIHRAKAPKLPRGEYRRRRGDILKSQWSPGEAARAIASNFGPQRDPMESAYSMGR